MGERERAEKRKVCKKIKKKKGFLPAPPLYDMHGDLGRRMALAKCVASSLRAEYKNINDDSWSWAKTKQGLGW